MFVFHLGFFFVLSIIFRRILQIVKRFHFRLISLFSFPLSDRNQHFASPFRFSNFQHKFNRIVLVFFSCVFSCYYMHAFVCEFCNENVSITISDNGDDNHSRMPLPSRRFIINFTTLMDVVSPPFKLYWKEEMFSSTREHCWGNRKNR